MEVNKYSGLEVAQKSVMVLDLTQPFVWHTLEAGKSVRTHTDEVDEWILINKGEFTITVGDNRENRAHLTYNLKGRQWLVFYIPAGQKHAFKARSYVSYFVLKGNGKK